MKNTLGKQFWLKKFGEAYGLNWKEKGFTQKEFADAINEVRTGGRGTIGTCTSQQVSKWLNDTIPSSENIEAICEVLSVPADYFEPSDREKYRDSRRFITNIGKTSVGFARKLGLDLTFFKAVRNIVDCDLYFPVYSEMCNISKELGVVKYGRKINADSAPIDKSLSFLQINRDGKTITLSFYDLLFLREVQDKVADYIQYLFYQRWEEMNKAVERANKDGIKELKDGGKATVILNLAEYDKAFTRHGEKCISINDINREDFERSESDEV